jgi:sugar O-acyltransferase (sialic acid O-acetyltransferase NeuD family)
VKVAIIGAGGLARQILDAVDACQDAGQDIEAVGFIDEDAGLWGAVINERPVLGNLDWFEGKDVQAIIGIGSPDVRRRVAIRAAEKGVRFCTLMHPTAVLSRYATVGAGVAILAGAVIESHVRLGQHVIVNKLCSIGHDTVVEDYCTLAPGALIAGNVHLGQGCDIGIGAATVQGVSLGEGVVIGGQAMVVRDVPADSTAVGVPATVIKVREPGWATK